MKIFAILTTLFFTSLTFSASTICTSKEGELVKISSNEITLTGLRELNKLEFSIDDRGHDRGISNFEGKQKTDGDSGVSYELVLDELQDTAEMVISRTESLNGMTVSDPVIKFENCTKELPKLVCNGKYNKKAIKVLEGEDSFSLEGYKSALKDLKGKKKIELNVDSSSTFLKKDQRIVNLSLKDSEGDAGLFVYFDFDLKTKKGVFNIEEYEGNSEMPVSTATIKLDCN